VEIEGLIFDIRKFSLHDGPGIRTTVFFKGCPLSCWWCHNPESQSASQEVMLWESRCIGCGLCIPSCPLGAIERVDGQVQTDRDMCVVCSSCMDSCPTEARELVGRKMTVNAVMREVARDAPFYAESGGGVTFSGGEPLAQRAFLAELLRRCKALELHTTVDTSGYTPWKILDSVRRDVDLFLYDLKLMDDARHRRYTGVPNGLILRNLEALVRCGQRVIVRVPVIPGVNDDETNLTQTADFVRRLEGVERVDLLPYHPSASGKYERIRRPNRLPDTPSPSEIRMQEIAELLTSRHIAVTIGG
jgi:pyruvate formate lyase activating enzyme